MEKVELIDKFYYKKEVWVHSIVGESHTVKFHTHVVRLILENRCGHNSNLSFYFVQELDVTIPNKPQMLASAVFGGDAYKSAKDYFDKQWNMLGKKDEIKEVLKGRVNKNITPPHVEKAEIKIGVV